MESVAGNIAILIGGVISIVVLLNILVLVRKQAKKMQELQQQMKVFEKANEEREE